MKTDFLLQLEAIRSYELEIVKHLLGNNRVVLEIGSGAGWQAQQLAQEGHTIIAIDLPDSNYHAHQMWNVIPYDGVTIPLASNSVDVVFSSNVLEHIPHVRGYQSEIHRVLKKDGLAIHVLPTGTWRFWTTLTHYIHYLARAYRNVKTRHRDWLRFLFTNPKSLARPTWYFFRSALFNPRHGEFGNTLTEIYYFSRWRWQSLFKKTGWVVKDTLPNHLFYTGYGILGKRLPISVRHRMSYLLGSACNVYVLSEPSREHV